MPLLADECGRENMQLAIMIVCGERFLCLITPCIPAPWIFIFFFSEWKGCAQSFPFWVILKGSSCWGRLFEQGVAVPRETKANRFIRFQPCPGSEVIPRENRPARRGAGVQTPPARARRGSCGAVGCRHGLTPRRCRPGVLG